MNNGGTEDAQGRRDEGGGVVGLFGAEGRGPARDGSGGSWRSVAGFRGLVWGASTLLLVAWCVVALGIGVNYASTFWEWAPIMVFGLGVPAAVLWQANRVLAPAREIPIKPSAKDKEKELLTAFSERGELTAVTAAMRTSLTADEAAKMLDWLAGKGYVRMRVDDGLQAYALPGPDRREMPPGTAPISAAPVSSEGAGSYRPPGEDLSEREVEVLALLASGRTNSEIAGDLFVAHGTVKAHVANIYRKLGASNRAEAVSRARGLKLLP